MKEIKFRPLRRHKSGKIIVASYAQWRKLATANYSKFKLIIDEYHKSFKDSELVYSHKLENLFFYDFTPADIKVNLKWDDGDYMQFRHDNPYLVLINDTYTTYWCKGLDCDGVPTFSHFTANYIGSHINDISKFEPLTVGIVKKWLFWMIYNLENSILK